MDRKKVILIIVVCLFASALIYRIFNPYKQKKVQSLRYKSERTGAKVKKKSRKDHSKLSEKKHVMLNLFLNQPSHSGNVLKNIFIEKEIIQKEMKKIEKNETEPEKVEKPVLPKEDPREKVNQELSKFRVFGSYQSGDETILFLERGKDILVVREGDSIDGKYRVKEIEKQKLILRAMQINEDVHIDLSDF